MAVAAFRSRMTRLAMLSLTASIIPLMGAATPASAGPYVAISGSGTSWPSIAIDQWAQAVRARGIVVNYNPDGSSAGRADYMANQDDFAGSDPPFRSGFDQLGGVGPEHPSQGYSYIPDAAGGTAFPYHLTVHGHPVTNLQLSVRTLMGIFTGKITNWDSPQITRDNGRRLPNLPITPVIHAEGGQGAAAFAVFALCAGQRDLSRLGYAPLPHALAYGGLYQAAHIPGHGPIPAPAHCR